MTPQEHFPQACWLCRAKRNTCAVTRGWVILAATFLSGCTLKTKEDHFGSTESAPHGKFPWFSLLSFLWGWGLEGALQEGFLGLTPVLCSGQVSGNHGLAMTLEYPQALARSGAPQTPTWTGQERSLNILTSCSMLLLLKPQHRRAGRGQRSSKAKPLLEK